MYSHQKIEKKWQEIWEKEKLYKTLETQNKPKFYILDMFPYLSGVGLHVGHPKGYIATDIFARFKMMRGCNVLHPMGWDAFGLPAENYAIQNKIHPRIAMKKNIATFKKQLGLLGFTYDWEREINTTDPEYYKWTQWVFLKMFEKGLAYESYEPINWCPGCQTGLSNEDLEDGKCERCGSEIEKKPMRQWMLRITDYAERLLNDLEKLPDWEESIKEMQRNWIGRSEGAIVKFPMDSTSSPQASNFQFSIDVYTTRIDTIFSGTYIILAPEHKFFVKNKNKINNWQEVSEYILKSKNISEIERTAEGKDWSGVELKGIQVINPATDEKMSVWVADFVLGNYGTGAVFADAHDKRDFYLAKKYKIPLKVSIAPNKESINEISKLEKCFEGEGILFNSDQFNGMTSVEARPKIITWLKEKDLADVKVNYKLKDWVFSRQRYWGEPIPIAHCEKCGVVALEEKDLPLKLPEVENYKPTGTGESPLADIKEWVNTICPKCGGPAKRETNTMPQWAGSSWYYLRYIDPQNKKVLVDKTKEKYWSPVDFYVGGAEHATRHLIYARFWHKFLYDIGVVNYDEPFTRLQHVGLILAEDGRKMSKRWNNIINPDEIVEKYGADAMRVYEMFMGPFSQSCAWSANGLIGAKRFLDKVYKIISNFQFPISKFTPMNIGARIQNSKSKIQNIKLKSLLHKTIKKVTEDIENFKFNTAISSLMILVNEMEKQKELQIADYQLLIILLSPFVPHLAEELWQEVKSQKHAPSKSVGSKVCKVVGAGLVPAQSIKFKSIFQEKWPKYDSELAKDENINLVIQINGKIRDVVEVVVDINEDEAKKLALESEIIKKWTPEENQIKKIIFVPGKLINIVI